MLRWNAVAEHDAKLGIYRHCPLLPGFDWLDCGASVDAWTEATAKIDVPLPQDKGFVRLYLCLEGISEIQWNFDICDISLPLRRKAVY
jgi:hypothetical protein